MEKIISKDKWLDFINMSAFFIYNGDAQECVDKEFEVIESEVINGASEDINADFEKMVLLKERYYLREEAQSNEA